MSHTPLGEVCLTLGLMRAEDVDEVLARLRDGGRARFGEIAMELGLLDDDRLARALAQQFRLNMVPAERLARLSVAPEVLDLLPRGLVRERLLVPTFLDEEKRVLSLLTVDPTDIPSLRAAQTAARAARLRLFVASRGAMRSLVDRLLPPEELDERPLDRSTVAIEVEPTARGITVVFEPDAERATALRRLEATEGGAAEVVGDPEQVSAFIEANQADRVFFRRAVLAQVEPYLPAWRRLRPLVQICALDGFGPSRRVGIPYDRTRDFFFGLLQHLLDGEGAGGPGHRSVELARAMTEQTGMPDELRDAVVLAALFAALGDASEQPDTVDEAGRIAWAAERLKAWSPPYGVQVLFDALAPRVRGESGPGDNAGAEILYTARAAARAGMRGGDDPVALFGADAARHDAEALRSLTAVLHRWGLRERVEEAGTDGNAVVVLAAPGSELATSLRGALGREGYTVAIAGDVREAARLARALRAEAVAAEPGGRAAVEAALREGGAGAVPVVSVDNAADAAPGRTAVPDLLGALRNVLRRRPAAPAAISGRLSELSLVELLQTLTRGGRTAQVSISGVADVGVVQVREGRLAAATHGPRGGDDALNSLVALTGGRFEVRFEDAGLNNLSGSTEFLLLEALRRRDERRS
jgi:hypothetical protein